MKTRKLVIILSAVFFFAVALVLYPFFANIHNEKLAEELIVEYEENLSGLEEGALDEILEEARDWNSSLSSKTASSYSSENLSRDEIYESLLNIYGDGMMGYIVIPDIDVNLPIYHYTTDEVLSKGAGHIETSSLPVGGEGTHCVLTAHRGLPGSRLFTDLDQIEEGDIFYLEVLGETLAYEVISIEVVEPEDTDSLAIVSGEDLCTLVTCTPYGINTHRLLVTGKRTDYEESLMEYENGTYESDYSPDMTLLYVAFIELIIYVLVLIRIKRKRRS